MRALLFASKTAPLKTLLVSLALFAASVSASANATTVVFSGTLSGANEVPANASTATGSFTATLDDVARTLSVDLTFSGLQTSATSASLHCCTPAGANAVSIFNFTGFPAATSGSYSGFVFGLSNANVTDIKSGLAYLNIRTAALPGGEIRGQLTPSVISAVPESATWAMMIVGFGAVGTAMRRRRKDRVSFP